MKNKKLHVASLSSLLVLFLTSCDVQGAADNISGSVEDTIQNVLPNLYVALAQLGAFLVMVFIFFRFCYKPIKERLHQRALHEKEQIDEAREKNLEAERNREVSEMNVKDSRQKADQIISDANKTAEKSAQEIIDKANERAEQIRIQGEKDAEEKKKEVERKAHDEIVSTAIAASKEILGRELTKEDNDKVIDDFIGKMKDKKE